MQLDTWHLDELWVQLSPTKHILESHRSVCFPLMQALEAGTCASNLSEEVGLHS